MSGASRGRIAIVDVCSGNLRSVEKALAAVGAKPVLTHDPDVIRRADKIVVPGQGAFGPFAQGMLDRHLDAPLREALAAGKPFLGICVGFQALFESSEEDESVAGLGLVPGRVLRFRPDDPALKVPHMGWNRVRPTALGAKDPILAGIGEAYVYFVHSYYVAPADPSSTALECDYGVTFAAAVRKDNLFGCQFHPEKSQKVGLAILRNFAAL